MKTQRLEKEADALESESGVLLELPESHTWWLFLTWSLMNLLTWVTAQLVPARTFTQNVDVPIPLRALTIKLFNNENNIEF